MKYFWQVKTIEEASEWAMRDAIRRAEILEDKLDRGLIADDKISWARASAEEYRAIAAEEMRHA